MSKQVTEIYNQLLTDAQKDPNILGFMLTGSRGKGAETVYSDYDILQVVNDENIAEYNNKYKNIHDEVEVAVMSLSEFKVYADWGSENEWDRYNFAHIKALVDKKSGLIQQLIDEKGSFPLDKIKNYVSGALDAYINSLYRSLKNFRDGKNLAGRLDAVESLNFFWSTVFVFHNRLRPYNKYLEWEINTYPLDKLPWTTQELTDLIIGVLSSDPIRPQQALLRGLEDVLQPAGYVDVFDGWGNKLNWMKTYSV